MAKRKRNIETFVALQQAIQERDIARSERDEALRQLKNQEEEANNLRIALSASQCDTKKAVEDLRQLKAQYEKPSKSRKK